MKNRKTKLSSLATAIIVFSSLTSGSSAAILITISDNGTDLTMTAVGSYDFTGVAPSASVALGANAAVAPLISGGGLYGWETGNSDRYAASSSSGSLTGTSDAFPADSATATVPFVVILGSSSVNLAQGSPATGTVNNSATFNGVTLASLGLAEGQSITLRFPQDTVTIITIPEPSSPLLLGLAGLGCLSFRRRK